MKYNNLIKYMYNSVKLVTTIAGYVMWILRNFRFNQGIKSLKILLSPQTQSSFCFTPSNEFQIFPLQ